MVQKNKTGVKARILAISILLALLAALLGCSTVYAQQNPNSATSNMAQNLPQIFNPAAWGTESTGALPLWFTFQDNMEAHAGELQNNMFQYRIDNAPSDAEKAQLIQLQNMVLQNATINANLQIQAMTEARQNHDIEDVQYYSAIHRVNERINESANYVSILDQVASNLTNRPDADDIEQDISDLKDDLDEINVHAQELQGIYYIDREDCDCREVDGYLECVCRDIEDGDGEWLCNNRSGYWECVFTYCGELPGIDIMECDGDECTYFKQNGYYKCLYTGECWECSYYSENTKPGDGTSNTDNSDDSSDNTSMNVP